jgi:prepilin-type N-terminal cleavage/methylation domain-containing protein
MKNVKNVKKNNKGFSLVELIVVIAIMAVLVGVLAPTFLGYVKKSKVSTDLQNAQEISSQISVIIADGELSTSSDWGEVPADLNSIKITQSAIKAASGYKWYYMVSSNQVHVGVSADGSTVTELYPTTPTSGTWSTN